MSQLNYVFDIKIAELEELLQFMEKYFHSSLFIHCKQKFFIVFFFFREQENLIGTFSVDFTERNMKY